MVRWSLNWREVAVAWLWHFPSTFLEGMGNGIETSVTIVLAEIRTSHHPRTKRSVTPWASFLRDCYIILEAFELRFRVVITVVSSSLDGLGLAFQDKIYSDWLILFCFKERTGFRLDGREVEVLFPIGLRIFSSRRSDQLWSPPCLLSIGYRGIFP